MGISVIPQYKNVNIFVCYEKCLFEQNVNILSTLALNKMIEYQIAYWEYPS